MHFTSKGLPLWKDFLTQEMLAGRVFSFVLFLSWYSAWEIWKAGLFCDWLKCHYIHETKTTRIRALDRISALQWTLVHNYTAPVPWTYKQFCLWLIPVQNKQALLMLQLKVSGSSYVISILTLHSLTKSCQVLGTLFVIQWLVSMKQSWLERDMDFVILWGCERKGRKWNGIFLPLKALH